MNSVLDRLGDVLAAEGTIEEEVQIPEKCSECKMYPVCTIFPTFIAMAKLGVIIEVKQCPYHGKQNG